MLKLHNLPKNTRCPCAVVQSRQPKPSSPPCKVGLWCLWYGSCRMSLTEKKAKILMLFEGLSCIAWWPKETWVLLMCNQDGRGSWLVSSRDWTVGLQWLCTAGSGGQQLWWRLLKQCSESQMSFVPLVLLTAPHPTWPACMEGSEHTALPRQLEPLAGSLCFEREMWIWEELLSLSLL